MSDYVRTACPACKAAVKIETDSLGEWVTCPKCDKDFVAKDRSAPVRPAPHEGRDEERPRSRRRDYEEGEDEERPRERSRRDEDEERPRSNRSKGGGFSSRGDEEDDEDERPRRRGSRRGVCPGCGSRKSSRVSYTWWGGLVGPAVFGLVRCGRCQKQYMGGSGKPLGALQIILYSLVVGGIGIGILALVGAAAR
ncbi:MAG TPA: hypothetical protein VGE74_28880 [Gemmata sp.]